MRVTVDSDAQVVHGTVTVVRKGAVGTTTVVVIGVVVTTTELLIIVLDTVLVINRMTGVELGIGVFELLLLLLEAIRLEELLLNATLLAELTTEEEELLLLVLLLVELPTGATGVIDEDELTSLMTGELVANVFVLVSETMLVTGTVLDIVEVTTTVVVTGITEVIGAVVVITVVVKVVFILWLHKLVTVPAVVIVEQTVHGAVRVMVDIVVIVLSAVIVERVVDLAVVVMTVVLTVLDDGTGATTEPLDVFALLGAAAGAEELGTSGTAGATLELVTGTAAALDVLPAGATGVLLHGAVDTTGTVDGEQTIEPAKLAVTVIVAVTVAVVIVLALSFLVLSSEPGEDGLAPTPLPGRFKVCPIKSMVLLVPGLASWSALTEQPRVAAMELIVSPAFTV